MGNGDDRYRSRKFRLAVATLAIATVAMAWGLVLCETAGDVAIVMSPWGTAAALVLGLYSHYNVKDDGGE